MYPDNSIKSVMQSFQDLRAAYAAAIPSRFRRNRNLPYVGQNADTHYSERDYCYMMEYARALDRDDPVISQMVKRVVDNTIEDGFQIDPRTGDIEIDKMLSQMWKDWKNDPSQCDDAGEENFDSLTAKAFRHQIVDGDIIGLPMSEGSLQVVEGHRLRTPTGTKRNVIHGVLMDDRRKRQEYWITKSEVSLWATVGLVKDIQPYKVRDNEGNRILFHLYNPDRVSQTRGISAFHAIFDIAGMFDDLTFSTLVKANVSSAFITFREREANFLNKSFNKSRISTYTEDVPYPYGGTRTIKNIQPGTEIIGAPGETLKGYSPNIPNPEYFPHCRLLLTIIGINLGLPLVIAIMDASETNFSGYRGALDQAKQGWKSNQRCVISKWVKPVYIWQVSRFISKDPALYNASRKSGINIYNHAITPPRWGYIEPMKDAQADVVKKYNNLESPSRIAAERGIDFSDMIEETIRDNSFIIRKAIEAKKGIEVEFPGEIVSWREIATGKFKQEGNTNGSSNGNTDSEK
jgi:capsid protein